MTVAPNQNKLIIPGKNSVGANPGYATDMRTIEQWANVGIIRSLKAGTNVTIDNPDGPTPTINASGGGGGYASLTGPGESATPGDLTQMGGFLAQFGLGHAFEVVSAGAEVFSIGSNNAIVLGQLTDPSITLSNLEMVLDDAAGDTITLQHGVGATITGISVRIQSAVGTTINVNSSGGASILGFYGVTPVPRAAHPTTLADVITILQNVGLCH